MKISIVIPTLNCQRFMRPCLDSIFNQTHQDFEVIVIDGGSKDGTMDILQDYRAHSWDRMRVYFEPPNGEPDAINHGISKATGDIHAWLDADDTYEQGCFSLVNEYFSSHKKVEKRGNITKITPIEWLYGRARIIDAEGMQIRQGITGAKELLQKDYHYHNLRLVDFIVQPTVFWRADFGRVLGKLRADLKYCFDYEYWLRAGMLSSPVFIDAHLANWRYHEGAVSVMGIKKEIRQAYDVQQMYSGKWYRPAQWLVYAGTNLIYKVI